MSQHKLLEVKDFSLTFRGKESEHTVYKGAGLSINTNEVIGLLGPSGSGKSVLAKAIFNGSMGNQALTSGSIHYLDKEGSETPLFPAKTGKNHHIYGNDVCLIFQEPGLAFNPVLTIGHQITEVVRKHQLLDKKESLKLLVSKMNGVGLRDPGHLNKYPHELSGGELQRFMILMATINRPRFLVADEPTTSLDSINQKEVLNLLNELHQQGTSLLVISHDPKVLNYLSAKVYEVKDQHLQPYEPKSSLSHVIDKWESENQENALTVDISSIRYKDFVAVEALRLKVKRHEILGIVGSSGCGKSTLAKAMCGLIPFAGQVSPAYPKGKIQMIFQHPGAALDPSQSIGNAVLEALKVSGVKDKKERKSRTLQLFYQVELDAKFMEYYPHQLSGGMKQRACIARALATSPELLICDEAVSSLDTELKERIAQLLISLSKERGMTLIFISHDIGLVERLSHRILVMDQGKVVDEINTKDNISQSASETLKQLMDARL